MIIGEHYLLILQSRITVLLYKINKQRDLHYLIVQQQWYFPSKLPASK